MLDPHEQLYHRLLAGKRDEADALLVETLRKRSPRRVVDDVLIPAVRMAEIDNSAGALDAAQRSLVRSFMETWARKLTEARTPASCTRRMAECLVRTEAWKPVEIP